MRRFFGRIENDNFIVDGEELKHLSNVIRLKENDEFIGVANDEYDYICHILSIDKKSAVAQIIERKKNISLPKKNLVLFQALTKKEAFEFVLQKAVELGTSEVVPFVSEYCVNKSGINMERYKTLIMSACKQCERSKIMRLSEAVKFDNMIEKLADFDIVVFANEIDGESFDFTSLKDYQNIAFVVGCEGGFSENEKNKLVSLKNVKSVNLGSRILRAETASIVLLGLGMIHSGN